jgi:hypothetical protein
MGSSFVAVYIPHIIDVAFDGNGEHTFKTQLKHGNYSKSNGKTLHSQGRRYVL